ncbi:MAG: hypothetical protein ACP5GZ_06390 [Vulcanisaeta sp.]|uniref:hypothetical protein n=1 Tax=Vulcanisaeta sp. TaxID=2020871 RepID=UPI003D11914E
MWDEELIRAAKFVARANSVMIDLEDVDLADYRHLARVIWDKPVDGLGALIMTEQRQEVSGVDVPTYLKITELSKVNDIVETLAGKIDRISGVVIDADDNYLEMYLVRLDVELRRRGIREDVDLIIHMPSTRSSGDIVKLVALGADAVTISGFVERALHGYTDIRDFRLRFMKFLVGIKREIAIFLVLLAYTRCSPSWIIGNCLGH